MAEVANNRSVLLIPLLAAFSFGLYPAAARLAYADGANAVFVVLTTTFARAVVMAIFCMATGKRWIPSPGEWSSVLSGGFYQALSIFGIIASLVYLPGPVTMTIIFTHTLMLLFLLAFRGEIRLSWLAVCTTLAALIGVSLVVDVWHNLDGVHWIGVSLAFMAALATVSRIYVYGKQVRDVNPAIVGAQMFSAASLFLLPLLIFEAPVAPSSLEGVSGVVWCALSLILGTFAMFYGIALLGSFKYSLMVKVEPIFTAGFSFLVLGELLNGYQYCGMVLVIVSLITYQYFDSVRGDRRS